SAHLAKTNPPLTYMLVIGNWPRPSCRLHGAPVRWVSWLGWLRHRSTRLHRRTGGFSMSQDDFPAPQTGFVVTHFLVVSDQDRSREFSRSVFGATVLLERDPVILRLANSWLILNVGGGPTDDKPAVTLTTPPDPNQASAFLNVRVADIA